MLVPGEHIDRLLDSLLCAVTALSDAPSRVLSSEDMDADFVHDFGDLLISQGIGDLVQTTLLEELVLQSRAISMLIEFSNRAEVCIPESAIVFILKVHYRIHLRKNCGSWRYPRRGRGCRSDSWKRKVRILSTKNRELRRMKWASRSRFTSRNVMRCWSLSSAPEIAVYRCGGRSSACPSALLDGGPILQLHGDPVGEPLALMKGPVHPRTEGAQKSREEPRHVPLVGYRS